MQLWPQLTKLHEPIDRAQQMIGWYVPIERKLIEQRSLFDFPMSHRDSQSCFSQQLNQRTSWVATPTFSNSIDPKAIDRFETIRSPSISIP